MRTLRRHHLIPFFVLALVLWLTSDAALYRACSHDLIPYAQAGRSNVGNASSPNSQSSDRGDVNRCSCHWQYIPVPVLLPAEALVSAPLACTLPPWTPQHVVRTLERPPQARLA